MIKYLQDHPPDALVSALDLRNIADLQRMTEENKRDQNGQIDLFEMGMVTKQELILIQHKAGKSQTTTESVNKRLKKHEH